MWQQLEIGSRTKKRSVCPYKREPTRLTKVATKVKEWGGEGLPSKGQRGERKRTTEGEGARAYAHTHAEREEEPCVSRCNGGGDCLGEDLHIPNESLTLRYGVGESERECVCVIMSGKVQRPFAQIALM